MRVLAILVISWGLMGLGVIACELPRWVHGRKFKKQGRHASARLQARGERVLRGPEFTTCEQGAVRSRSWLVLTDRRLASGWGEIELARIRSVGVAQSYVNGRFMPGMRVLVVVSDDGSEVSFALIYREAEAWRQAVDDARHATRANA